MARAKGMLNLSGNIEVLAGAPFDAREVVPTKADLTTASNFQYPYIGMETYVTAENKKYRYIGGDITQEASWEELGEGGGGGGGHTIQDDGTDMTARDNLNFIGMEVDDNSTDNSTDVAEHRLTSAEISEILGEIPNPSPRMPIMFDERGTEYQVGWYVLSNGTKKPVYRHNMLITLKSTTSDWYNVIHGVANIENIIEAYGMFSNGASNTEYKTMPYLGRGSSGASNVGFTVGRERVYLFNNSSESGHICRFTFFYTKTTDTPA